MGIEVRDQSRNQSTADISIKEIFIFDNYYKDEVLKNTASLTIPAGTALVRLTDGTVDKWDPVGGNTPNLIVGFSTEEVTGQNKAISMCYSGSVNKNYLKQWDSTETEFVALDTDTILAETDGFVTAGDHLRRLGFKLESATQNTKFDN